MSASDFSLDAPAKPLPDLPGGDEVSAFRAWSGGLLVMIALAVGGAWWWVGATTGSWSNMLANQFPGLGRWLDTSELGRALVPLSGIQPGRSSGLVMAALAAVAMLWSVWRRQPKTTGWKQPEWWLLGALAWQLGVMLADGRFVEPGMVWWWERAAALALAVGLTWRWTGDPARGVAACAVVGMAVMGLDTLSRYPVSGGSIGDKYGIGVGAPFGLPNFNMGGGVPLMAVAFGWLLAAARPGFTVSGAVGAALLVLLCLWLPLKCWSGPQGWAPDISANKVVLWAVFGSLGTVLLLTLRSGPVLAPALAIGLAGALAGATGMWVGTANLATWIGLGAILAASFLLRTHWPRWMWLLAGLLLGACIALLGGFGIASILLLICGGLLAMSCAIGLTISLPMPRWSGSCARRTAIAIGVIAVAAAVAAVIVHLGSGVAKPLHPAKLSIVAGLVVSPLLLATLVICMPAHHRQTTLMGLGLVGGFATVFALGILMSHGHDLWTVLPGEPKPSVLQRLFCMGQSYEAFVAAPFTGYGTGTTVGVLQLQPSYPGAWLAVPSYLEHAHNESWQILVEGGLVGTAVLGVALWFSLAPLWRRRDEPMAKALLVGWAALIAQAQVESHLSQPGPLLCLAVLAAATWAFARTPAAQPAAAGAPPVVAALDAEADRSWPVQPTWGMLVLLALGLVAVIGEVRNGLREMGGFSAIDSVIGSGGSPSAIVHRMSMQWRDAESPDEKAAVLKRLQDRLGPLDILPGNQAAALLEGLQTQHRSVTPEQLAPVIELMTGQLRRMPADAGNLYRSSLLAAQLGPHGAALRDEVRASLEKAEAWLKRVPRTPHGGDEADKLRMVVNHLRANGYPAAAPAAPAVPPAAAPEAVPEAAPATPGTAAAPG
ncbi:MAG: hypothetical protein RLZZ127_164 [Planctomycetota bacterium]|jgi:hypothetical protein